MQFMSLPHLTTKIFGAESQDGSGFLFLSLPPCGMIHTLKMTAAFGGEQGLEDVLAAFYFFRFAQDDSGFWG